MKEEKLNQIIEELELQIADCFQAEKNVVHRFQVELSEIGSAIKSKKSMIGTINSIKTSLTLMESFYREYQSYEAKRYQLECVHDTLKDNKDE